MPFHVDIPSPDKEEMVEMGTFETRQEALDFAKRRFGADGEGRVLLVTESTPDDWDEPRDGPDEHDACPIHEEPYRLCGCPVPSGEETQ